MKQPLNWFEIAATDLDRAAAFYERGFEIAMSRTEMANCRMAMFPCDQGRAVGGAIAQSPMRVPGGHGVVLYLNGGDDLAVPLSRIEAAGGKILRGKTQITPEIGYFAIFSDCEGNTLGLHSPH